MRAIRLKAAGLDGLAAEQIATPEPGAAEALVRVHAAAITRDELKWPTDRLPAIPSCELSGVVVAAGPGADETPDGGVYFVVEPNREQLLEIAARVDAGTLRPTIDQVFELPDARAAFERSQERGTRGKVVLRVAGEEA